MAAQHPRWFFDENSIGTRGGYPSWARADIEKLIADEPGPWLASVTRAGVSIFDR